MKVVKKPKITIGSWAYAIGPYADNPIPLDEVCEGLHKLGFDGVELGGFKPHAHPDLYPTKKDRQNLVDMLNRNGLGVPAYAADLWNYPFAEGDPKVVKQYEEMFDRSLEFCDDCGIEIIRVDTVTGTPFPKKLDYKETWERVADMFRRCADKARDLDVKVVWEFEPGFIFNKPSEIRRMVQEVGEDNFQILFDTCHAHMCAAVGAKQIPPREVLPKGEMDLVDMFKGRIAHVHVIDSDNTLHDNETSTHAPLGQGVIDFEQILPALVKAGYDSEWWSIDLCFWPNAWDVTEKGKAYLDNLFVTLGWT